MSGAAPPRLAVVAGTPALVRAARDLGVRTTLVHDAAGPVPECAKDAEETIPVDLADPEDLHRRLAAAHAADPFDRVLSLTETGLVPAARAAERLALPGKPLATVTLLKDKRRMRELLNGAGLSPTAVSEPRDAAALADFCRAVGGPAVLKPAHGFASRAVVRVDGADDAERAWDRFIRLGGTDPVAEEYLDGPEVSVETFTHAGRHLVVAVTAKTVWPSFVEAGHTMPAALGPAEREQVETLVRDFLDLVGLTEGPAHTELRLTAAGPRVIESHDRIGGDKIRELVRRCHGIDLPALTVSCALGLAEPPEAVPPAEAGAAIRFLAPEPGVVRRIEIPETGRPDDVVHLEVEVGQSIGPVRRSEDRAGYVLVTGEDAADATARADALAARVIVETGR